MNGILLAQPSCSPPSYDILFFPPSGNPPERGLGGDRWQAVKGIGNSLGVSKDAFCLLKVLPALSSTSLCNFNQLAHLSGGGGLRCQRPSLAEVECSHVGLKHLLGRQ